MIDDLIDQMEQAGFPFLPGATEDEINDLIAQVNCPIPADLIALYRRHNGMRPLFEWDDESAAGTEDPARLFRLMTIKEVIELHPNLVNYGWADEQRLCYWTDDESNFLMRHVGGDLNGRCCVLIHDKPDPAPVYRTIHSFLMDVRAGGRTGIDYDSPTNRDYPPTAPYSADSYPEEALLADTYRNRFMAIPFLNGSEQTERKYAAYVALAITPWDQSESLYPFLDDDDSYIQKRTCESLGLRRYAPAVERLLERASAKRTGSAHSPLQAMIALERIGTPQAHKALLELSKRGVEWARGSLYETR